MTYRIIQADCVEAMREMPEASVDAIVTDPPYGLEFMGSKWDGIGRRIGHPLDPSKDISHDASIEPRAKDNPWQKERSGYGAPRKNARCQRCGRLRWTANACDCPTSDWDTRTAEYAHTMEAWHHTWATEALRVLKPGGHLLAFGGTRTYHRLVCAIEDAGFEIRDTLAWMYGSGFPKSLDVSKAIDRAAGAEREVVGKKPLHSNIHSFADAERYSGTGFTADVTAPSTEAAQRWQGWGTALKPAHEPIVLARKPLSEKNVAANVERWGTGALNIDGTRVGTDGEQLVYSNSQAQGVTPFGTGTTEQHPAGRWPANVVMDEEAGRMLDEQSGERTSGSRAAGEYGRLGGHGRYGTWEAGPMPAVEGDSGGASRFFKEVSWDERGTGDVLGSNRDPVPAVGDDSGGFDKHMADEAQVSDVWRPSPEVPPAGPPGALRFRYVPKADRAERNIGLDKPSNHPTVKPIALMAWLCRMVTPPGGTVLDPFCGSGSTGIAALREGFEFIGIEKEPEYVEIARARIQGDAPLLNVEAP